MFFCFCCSVAEELGGEQGHGFQTVQAQTTSPRQLATGGLLVAQQLGEPVLQCRGTQIRDSQEVDGACLLQAGGPDELLQARRLARDEEGRGLGGEDLGDRVVAGHRDDRCGLLDVATHSRPGPAHHGTGTGRLSDLVEQGGVELGAGDHDMPVAVRDAYLRGGTQQVDAVGAATGGGQDEGAGSLGVTGQGF